MHREGNSSSGCWYVGLQVTVHSITAKSAWHLSDSRVESTRAGIGFGNWKFSNVKFKCEIQMWNAVSSTGKTTQCRLQCKCVLVCLMLWPFKENFPHSNHTVTIIRDVPSSCGEHLSSNSKCRRAGFPLQSQQTNTAHISHTHLYEAGEWLVQWASVGGAKNQMTHRCETHGDVMMLLCSAAYQGRRSHHKT